MADEAKSQSWWHTLPGVLTAIAAAITATSGLIAALYQAGVIGKKEAATTPARTSTAKPAEQVAGIAQSPVKPASAPNDAPITKVELLDGREVVMQDGTGWKFKYTVVSAERALTSGGKQMVRLRVRVWTNASGGVVLWSDSFRLKVGDMSLKPVNNLNELAARDETKDGEVEFEIDAAVQEAVLSINVGGLNFTGNTKELSLKFV